jgi:hypothetical protein
VLSHLVLADITRARTRMHISTWGHLPVVKHAHMLQSAPVDDQVKQLSFTDRHGLRPQCLWLMSLMYQCYGYAPEALPEPKQAEGLDVTPTLHV